jgi:nicotinamidase-related amidase
MSLGLASLLPTSLFRYVATSLPRFDLRTRSISSLGGEDQDEGGLSAHSRKPLFQIKNVTQASCLPVQRLPASSIFSFRRYVGPLSCFPRPKKSFNILTMNLHSLRFLAALAVGIPVMSIQSFSAGTSLHLTLRSRAASDAVTENKADWEPKKTALIICDMWDDHWCKSAAKRVAEMAGPLNEVVKEARKQGVFIIHSPSNVTSFYNGTEQRRRAQNAPFAKTPAPLATAERWGTTWCWPNPKHEAVLPIDDSDMGCSCSGEKCTIREAWKRQIATIELAPEDALTDNGQETWNLLAARGIENVILCGVHLNMCVLGRPFAIRQQVYLGKNVALMRDFTDTMYNPERPPGVDHFTGTDLVVEHVEKHWCPTFLSSDLTGKPAFRFREDKR